MKLEKHGHVDYAKQVQQPLGHVYPISFQHKPHSTKLCGLWIDFQELTMSKTKKP